jgi:transcriptional regulator with XRE-family HTH domain
MKPEEKQALGRLIRDQRQRLNWTQERLAGAADINLRTVQRAEGGRGISSENLAAVAAALGLDERELRTLAATAGPVPPERRIALREVSTGKGLVNVLSRCSAKGWSLETALPDEHRYNEMVGEDMLELANHLEKSADSEKERVGRVRWAQGIVSLVRRMGFSLFAGTYIEELKIKKRTQKRRAMLVIAAPFADPRIVRTSKGTELDIVRDSRRMLIGAMTAGHGTAYDWLEDQLISKSDGEFRVKDEFRRIMGEVWREMNDAEQQERKKEQ